MAAFTVSANANFSDAAYSTRAGNDTYTINSGATLTIDACTRYGGNAAVATGNLGAVTITDGKLKIDGTKVRLIAYTSGTGNVPAVGTTITQGSVTATLVKVQATINAVPTAAAAAMPATGFITVKNVSGGTGAFAAGALTGIGATASGADVVGTLEVVGVDATGLGSSTALGRLATVEVTGAWYEAGTATGVANQQIQLPGNGLLNFYPGVQIETGVGTGVYEWWPNAGSLALASGPTDDRAKIVWVTSAGLLRIGHDGTQALGKLPVNGAKIRVANILTACVTSAAQQTNVTPNTTTTASGNGTAETVFTTRYDVTTSNGAAVSIDKANWIWGAAFAQPYSVSITNTAIAEQLVIQEAASPTTLTFVCVGAITTVITVKQFGITSCFAGGTVTDCVFTAYSLAASGRYTATMLNLSGFTFTRVKCQSLTIRGNVTTGSWSITNALNCTWDSCTSIVGDMWFNTCTNCTVTNHKHCETFSGTVVTTYASYAVQFLAKCNNVKLDGLSWLIATANTFQPYAGLVNISASDYVYVRNIGTYASPLSLGTTNGTGVLINHAGNSSNIKIQRVYATATRLTTFCVFNNADTIVTYENVFSDNTTADIPALGVLNAIFKGCGFNNGTAGVQAIYGTHFSDAHTSTTAGRIAIEMNEKTALSPSASAYTVDAGTPRFNSAGGLLMYTIGDQVTWETPYYIIGHTSFQNAAPTMTGGTIGNYTVSFAIDKNDGNGYGAFQTASGANLSAVTGIDATKGFKLKIRLLTTTGNATPITKLSIATNSSTTTQAYQYPLDSAPITVSGLITGSRVKFSKVSDGTVLYAAAESGGTVTYSDNQYTSAVQIEARKASAAPYYIPWVTQVTPVSGSTTSATALQQLDE